MNNCLNCDVKTKNAKFCSRSCSASYNNVKFPKKSTTRTNICKECGNKKDLRSKLCRSCAIKKAGKGDISLREALYTEQHRSSAFALVRTRARKVAKEAGIDKECKICGYNKHVEVAHINPISSFSESVLVSKINSLDNLVGLCPNCHWELDNGLVERSKIL